MALGVLLYRGSYRKKQVVLRSPETPSGFSTINVYIFAEPLASGLHLRSLLKKRELETSERESLERNTKHLRDRVSHLETENAELKSRMSALEACLPNSMKIQVPK
jgi:hypothetical protein